MDVEYCHNIQTSQMELKCDNIKALQMERLNIVTFQALQMERLNIVTFQALQMELKCLNIVRRYKWI